MFFPKESISSKTLILKQKKKKNICALLAGRIFVTATSREDRRIKTIGNEQQRLHK